MLASRFRTITPKSREPYCSHFHCDLKFHCYFHHERETSKLPLLTEQVRAGKGN